jgi:hypothetical protein
MAVDFFIGCFIDVSLLLSLIFTKMQNILKFLNAYLDSLGYKSDQSFLK